MTASLARGLCAASAILAVVSVSSSSLTLQLIASTAVSARAEPAATTVVGDPSNRAWMWDLARPDAAGSVAGVPRTVTVDQTANLTSQSVRLAWQHFSPSDTGGSAFPTRVYQCSKPIPAPSDCAGAVGSPVETLHSTVATVATAADGTGSVTFPTLTAEDDPVNMPCGARHGCSLVVEQWTGANYFGTNKDGSQGDGSQPRCRDFSLSLFLDPTSLAGNYAYPDQAGDFWDITCNWASRIVVPLTFAPSATDCPQRDNDFVAEGAPMAQRLIDQWRTSICRGITAGRPLQVGLQSLSEYQARSDVLDGIADVALTSQPATSSAGRAVRYAPVGISSIAIAFALNDATSNAPIRKLRLNARLLAKLLTQSYPGQASTSCAHLFNNEVPCAPEDHGNPDFIYHDPELLALNSSYSSDQLRLMWSYPLVVYGNSDVTHELTTWISSDPKAAAFLNGKPDRWGMHVNTKYLPSASPAYPISQFTANDPGGLTAQTCRSGTVAYRCDTAGMQNTWFPVSGIRTVAKNLRDGKLPSRQFSPDCTQSPIVQGKCANYLTFDPQAVGSRGLIGVVAAGDQQAYRLDAAQLETHTGSGKFVAPTAAALAAAVRAMRPNADKVTRTLDYSTLRDPGAYPLTMVTYAMVPACGLRPAKAAAIGTFLRYAASDAANTAGVQPGQLAPGNLPLPTVMRQQTTAVAKAIIGEARCRKAQPRRATIPVGTGPSGKPGSTVHPPVIRASGPAASSARGAVQSRVPAPNPPPTVADQISPLESAGASRVVLPLVLIVAAALMLAGPTVLLLTRTSVRATVGRHIGGLRRRP